MITVMTMTKAQRVGYWILLALFSIGMLLSAVMYITEAPRVVSEVTRLGYPGYFIKLLAAGKIAGVLALIFTKSPVVKEWCYACFTIALIAAGISHLAIEDPVTKVIVPLLFLTLLGACYKLEHPKHHLK